MAEQDSAQVAPASLTFWSFFVRAYAFVLIIAICGVIPGCNFMYSYHGGIFWLLLPFGLPYAVSRTGGNQTALRRSRGSCACALPGPRHPHFSASHVFH